MRRPAGVEPATLSEEEVKDLWRAGHTIALKEVPVELMMEEPFVVLEEVHYYHRMGKVSGRITGLVSRGDQPYLRMEPIGTTFEELLRLHSGCPDLVLRIHKCPPGCGMEDSGDDILHGGKVRRGHPAGDEGWVTNLKAASPPLEDELARLRRELEEAKKKTEQDKEEDIVEDRKTSRKKDKKKKTVKEKEKSKEKDHPKRREEDNSEDPDLTNGSRPRKAAQKSLRSVFGGTGLDPREKVRRRVQRTARKLARKKTTEKSSSSENSKSDDSSSEDEMETDEPLFDKESRVRVVADRCPGALAGQAIGQMRASMLQTLGCEDGKDGLQGIPLQYFRQVLRPKLPEGPMLREQLTLASIMDAIGRGRIAVGMDIAAQRLKSLEASARGTHWSVARRLEIAPQEDRILTGDNELRGAQRDVYQESRLKYFASQPDGRGQGQQKGKGKSGGKEESDKGDSRRKGGKGKTGRGDQWTKKEDQPKSG